MRTQFAKLVHHSKAAQNNPIAHMHMAGQLGVVGKNSVVANLTVMRQMNIGHDPVVISYRGDTLVASGSNVEGTKLSNDIAVPNDQFTGLTSIFFILRYSA